MQRKENTIASGCNEGEDLLWHILVVCVRHCGTTEDLQFDHIDFMVKAYPISRLLGCKWERQVGELDKCQLLCADCHMGKSKAEGSLVGNQDGERNGNAVLAEDDVREIRCLLDEGCTQQAIADRFGVTRSNIGHIGTGRSWSRLS